VLTLKGGGMYRDVCCRRLTAIGGIRSACFDTDRLDAANARVAGDTPFKLAGIALLRMINAHLCAKRCYLKAPHERNSDIRWRSLAKWLRRFLLSGNEPAHRAVAS